METKVAHTTQKGCSTTSKAPKHFSHASTSQYQLTLLNTWTLRHTVYEYNHVTEHWKSRHPPLSVLKMKYCNWADPGGRPVQGIRLQSLAFRDCGFESCWGSCMSVCCKCCVLSGRRLCKGPIPQSEESYRMMCVYVRVRVRVCVCVFEYD